MLVATKVFKNIFNESLTLGSLESVFLVEKIIEVLTVKWYQLVFDLKTKLEMAASALIKLVIKKS